MASIPEAPPGLLIGLESPRLNVSMRFSSSDADVTFRSSDDVLFSIHQKNIETHAAGFPPSEFQTSDEIVSLSEDAATLDLLFQLMYPRPPPDVNSLPFEALASLAEAAEKYEVYSVMYICKTRIKVWLPEYASEILRYAAKHGYPDVIGEIAPLMVDRPLSEMFALLPSHYFGTWLKYVEHWERVRQSACRPKNSSFCDCGSLGCKNALVRIMGKLAELKSLTKLVDTFDTSSMSCCRCLTNYANQWRSRVEEQMSSIPKYMELN